MCLFRIQKSENVFLISFRISQDTFKENGGKIIDLIIL